MKWQTLSPYFAESGDGKYRVSVTTVCGKRRYTAWRRIPREECEPGISERDRIKWRPLLYADDPESARSACESDALSRTPSGGEGAKSGR